MLQRNVNKLILHAMLEKRKQTNFTRNVIEKRKQTDFTHNVRETKTN